MLGTKSLVAAAAVAAVAVGGGGYLMTHSSTDAVAAPQSVVEKPVLTLTVGGAPAAKCMRPVDPAFLQEADFVFEGTVTGLSDGQATLQVTHAFHGDTGSEVQLQRKPDYSEALDFAKGQKYLLAASDGGVSDCLSGIADDPSLQHSYQEAFPG